MKTYRSGTEGHVYFAYKEPLQWSTKKHGREQSLLHCPGESWQEKNVVLSTLTESTEVVEISRITEMHDPFRCICVKFCTANWHQLLQKFAQISRVWHRMNAKERLKNVGGGVNYVDSLKWITHDRSKEPLEIWCGAKQDSYYQGD